MDFSEYMNTMLSLLCKRMQAEEGTIYFCLDTFNGRFIHFDSQIWCSRNRKEGTKTAYLCCKVKPDPVLYHAMTVVTRYLSHNDSLRLDAENSWFFNAVSHAYHTPVTLADEIYWTVTSEMLARYSLATGVNLNLVASILNERYETSEAKGMLAFVDNYNSNWESLLQLKFDSSIDFTLEQSNLRLLRKLLEGAGNGILLFVRENSEKLYHCVGYVNNKYEKHFPRMAMVERRGIWIFREANSNIFRMRMGEILCLHDSLEACLPLLQAELNCTLEQDMKNMIYAVARQKHGSAVIFVDINQERTAARVNRLKKANRAIEVIWPQAGSVDVQTFTHLAKVDGALLVNIASNQIQFINTIVDGEAIVTGYFDSGARRNVISCFIANIVHDDPEAKGAALIFSEDGGCKLICGSQFRDELNKT